MINQTLKMLDVDQANLMELIGRAPNDAKRLMLSADLIKVLLEKQ